MNNIEYYKNRKVVEPSIIQETRDLIKQSFIGLKFVEDSHQYFVYQDKKKIEYSCVSNPCSSVSKVKRLGANSI